MNWEEIKAILKEFKGILNSLKELEIPFHVVNSSFKEFKGFFSRNLKEFKGSSMN